MFFKITGLLWICLGIWWVMRPQTLKRRFRRKVKKTRRRMLLFFMFLVVVLFFSAARYANGIIANIFLIMGVFGIIKVAFFLTSKAADRAIDWWLEKPLWMWRLWAVGFILIGILFQKSS